MVHITGLRGPSGEFGALGVVEVPSNAKDVWAFVADVEQQPEWYQGVKQSRIVERQGNRKSVHQVLSWNFLALRGDMHLRLCQEEDPRALTISTELTQGTMMRKFRSRVGVRDKSPGVCELQMEMFMQPAIFVPFGIRAMVGGQVRRQLRGVLSALQARFEERAALEAARSRRQEEEDELRRQQRRQLLPQPPWQWRAPPWLQAGQAPAWRPPGLGGVLQLLPLQLQLPVQPLQGLVRA